MRLRRDLAKKILVYTALAAMCLVALSIIWSLGLDETPTLVLTLIILLLLPAAILADYLMSRRGRRSVEAVAKEVEAQPSQPRGVYTELNANADEAVKWIRDNVRDAKSGDPLYSLPWFLVAGPHKSGKTSMLISANLDYQKMSQLRAEENDVKPTRNCDWRITNSAVLIDTAGRYQTEGPGSDEWLALIETLKRVRGRRPIDGLILVISLARLLEAGDQENETQARIMRDRVDELIAQTQTKFPVYLVLTHADSVEGFEEYFRSIDPAQRSQAWGATFNLDQAQSSHAQFDAEFNKLFENLMTRRLHCLTAVSRPIEHLRVFLFPLRFRQFRRKIGLFVETLFRSNPLKQSPLLRGFYFIGAPVHSRQTAPGQAGVFAQDLFHRILARDGGVAAAWQSHQQKPRPWREALAGVAGLALLALTLGVIVSYFSNRDLIRRASERGLAIERLVQDKKLNASSSKTANDASGEMRALDNLRRQLVELDEYDQSRPLSLSFGLYSGDSIKPYLRAIYFEQVYHHMLKPTAAALGQDLLNFDPRAANDQSSDPAQGGDGEAISERDKAMGDHYDRLKAYLMMSNLKPSAVRVDPALLSEQLSGHLKCDLRLRDDETSEAKEHLSYYARQAETADAPKFHFSETNPEIDKARNNLSDAYQLVVYKGAISRLQFDSLSVDKILGDERKDWLTGSYVVPGTYTIEAYREYKKNLDQVSALAEQEKWVLGNKAVKVSGGVKANELESRYLNDYVKHWRNFIRNIRVQGMTRDNESAVLEEMSDPDSPLEKVLRGVARQTNISATPTGRLVGWLKSFWSSKTGYSVTKNKVEDEFGPLYDFLRPGKESPLLKYQQALRELSVQMAGAPPEGDPRKDPRIAGAQKALAAPLNVFRSTSGFKSISAQYTADLLNQPVKRMLASRSGEVRGQLINEWNSTASAALKFENSFKTGFPFNNDSGPTVQEFNDFFNPMDGQLKKMFDNQAVLPDNLVSYLENAQRLRDAFYPANSRTASVPLQFAIERWSEPDKFVEVKIDNCPAASTQGLGSIPCTWPMPGGEVGAQIRILGTTDQKPIGEMKFPGEWGMFRMFNSGNPRPNSEGGYDLVWSVSGYTVRGKLKPSKTPNPFQRALYRDWQTPQNLSN